MNNERVECGIFGAEAEEVVLPAAGRHLSLHLVIPEMSARGGGRKTVGKRVEPGVCQRLSQSLENP